MIRASETIEITWDGPCSWPGHESENGLNPIPRIPGVYLQTFEYQQGYLIYAAGITQRPVPVRFREHTQNYLDGKYTVLDIAAAQQGVRKEIWHGWHYEREHRDEFEERKSILVEAVHRQLAAFRIFVADLGERGKEKRILERLEAAIMLSLYEQPPPICDIPDRGMHLAPRWDSERPIHIKSSCHSVLLGLPHCLQI